MTGQPVRVGMHEAAKRAYIITEYTIDDSGTNVINTGTMTEVTHDVVNVLMARAWRQGWDACNSADLGTSVRNPYLPEEGEDE